MGRRHHPGSRLDRLGEAPLNANQRRPSALERSSIIERWQWSL